MCSSERDYQYVTDIDGKRPRSEPLKLGISLSCAALARAHEGQEHLEVAVLRRDAGRRPAELVRPVHVAAARDERAERLRQTLTRFNWLNRSEAMQA